ncbi:MAG TPA: hypothetical protein VJI13_02285 [Candidatus Norongarragalinales archaeon]|nr:hypothetical protein [Candidatus Norongarragalinales archaeon]
MKFRAQAAVEYLMILAVVIIIALVVVGVLGGFPTLTAGISEKESAAYWTTADVGIVRAYVSGTDVKMVLRNNKNFAITLSSVDVGAGITSPLTDTLQPGETTGQITVFTLTTGCTAGATFTYPDVTIVYSDAAYLTSYTFTGAKPLVGTCQ